MERVFAASTARLRPVSSQARGVRRPLRSFRFVQRDDVLLDRVAPALFLMFLAIAAISVAVQFNSSRESSLTESENALTVAAHLVAGEITQRIEKGENVGQALTALPRSSIDGGRRHLVLDQNDVIRWGIGAGQLIDRPVRDLFAEADEFSRIRARTSMQRVALQSGDMVSLIHRPLPAPYALLVTLQPIEDELASWRSHAYTVGAVIFCFGAVTIAFWAAYTAQRERARDAGASATHIETRLEVALHRGRCGLWDHGIEGGDTVWSASMWRLLGYSDGEDCISRAEIEEQLHPQDLSPLAMAVTTMANGEREIDHLFRMRHADGDYLWLRMRGSIVEEDGNSELRLLAFVMDVTEERRIEEESHRADLRLRDAIESISEAFVLWDENNQLVMCNTKYQRFHALPTELVQRGTRYRDLMDEAQEPRAEIEIPRDSEQVAGARAYEAQFQDGRWLLINERPTRHGGFVSVGTDITARKLQEEQLMENERQLRLTIADLGASRETLRRQASQLAELADRYLEQKAQAISAARMKAEFLANMNHEMRTPLNAIIGFAEAMQQQMWGPIGSGKYADYVDDIRHSGENLLLLVNDVLEMANIEAGRVEISRSAEPIGAILAEAAESIGKDAATKHVMIEVDPEENVAAGQRLVNVDRSAMSQALTHLLRNAVRLSPKGGRVSIRARLQGENMNIFIADAGCMLTASEIGAMRDPFGHIDPMLENGCKGSGLGFPIAKALIELHGGTLRMRSSPQYGSLVMAHLPIAPEPVQLTLPIPFRSRAA